MNHRNTIKYNNILLFFINNKLLFTYCVHWHKSQHQTWWFPFNPHIDRWWLLSARIIIIEIQIFIFMSHFCNCNICFYYFSSILLKINFQSFNFVSFITYFHYSHLILLYLNFIHFSSMNRRNNYIL